MAKILINYDYKYYPMTTASYLEMAFRRQSDLTVFRLGEQRASCADFIINVEPCEKIISLPGAISCYWEIDNHMHQGQAVERYNAVDYLFVTQKLFLPMYPDKITTWLPLGADPTLHKLYPEEPIEYDIGFLGNDTYKHRKALLDLLGEKYNLLRATSKAGEEYSRLLSRCKLTFNCAMFNDMNMRFFEAIATGRMLLSDKVAGQDECFKDGEHYVSYTDADDLLQKVDYYLANEKEREEIASAGAKECHTYHTYENRMFTMLETMGCR